MEILISSIKVILIPVIVLNLLPLLIWMERKGAAYFQDRRGPNRASIFGIRLGGMVHNLADVIKLLTKEEFSPPGANRFYFLLAPFIVLFIYIVTVAVIPFGDDLRLGDWTFTLRAADLNVGVLYIFSMASLAVYGIMLAGWSSNNKYSLLGALRASSQMISYEIALGLSVVSLFMISESVDLNEIIRHQTPSIFSWNFFRQPLAFLLFLVAAFAETNRTPFDLPEGESELVAGYHVEYSGMRFGMFYMGEYVAIIPDADEDRSAVARAIIERADLPLVSFKRYRMLRASVTYYRGEPGDEAIVFVPKDAPSTWAAVENIVKR